MPVINVTLSFPDQHQWHGPLTAIVDSGADFTIVPLSIVTAMNLPVVGEANLVSQWQDRREVHVYQLDIKIGSGILSSVEIAGDPDSEELVLGRNILNDLDLRLNGPTLRVELAEAVVE
jgi:predicted aspartyl protease